MFEQYHLLSQGDIFLVYHYSLLLVTAESKNIGVSKHLSVIKISRRSLIISPNIFRSANTE